MKTTDIDNTHKLLIENNVQRRRPDTLPFWSLSEGVQKAMILRQVNMLSDYLRDIEQGIFRGPKTEELDALQDLVDAITYLMGFSRPQDSGYYADLLLHSDPQLKPKAKKGESK